MVREAAERAEAERQAREREEADRQAREAAARAEEQPPVSSRQPISRDDFRTAEELTGLEEEDASVPESGEVASQRKPTEPLAALEGWVDEEAPSADLESAPRRSQPRTVPAGAPPEGVAEVRFLVDPAPPRAETPAAIGLAPPVAIDVAADAVQRATLQGEVATFIGAVRRYRPATFGDLLDRSLALGEDE